MSASRSGRGRTWVGTSRRSSERGEPAISVPWVEILVVGALILVNALFSGTEIALISLREGQLRRLEGMGGAGRAVVRLARQPNQFLATIQVGITLAGFLASAFAAISIAEPLVDPLGFLGAAAEPVAVVLVTLVLTFVTLVVGELAPKRVAMQRAERWALMAARPLSGVALLVRPAVILLSWSTDLLVRVLGGDPDLTREAVTEEEMRELVVAHPELSAEHRAVLAGAFEVGDRVLREILIPRREITMLHADQQASDALVYLAREGRSRAPVIEDDDLDSVIGVAHMRDLLGSGTVRDASLKAPLLPEGLTVLDALSAMRAERAQMAIVIDEHGGAEGIVTVEDLLEEIVGEIYDETDDDVLSAHRRQDGSFVLPGTFPMHGLGDLGIDLPAGDYATIAGLILDRMGRVPTRRGESVMVGRWRLVVQRLDGRAVTVVSAHPIGQGATPTDRP